MRTCTSATTRFRRAPRSNVLLAGGADVLFPGERLVHRAREILPNLREVIFEPDAGHIHVGFVIGPHMDRVRAFLVEESR